MPKYVIERDCRERPSFPPTTEGDLAEIQQVIADLGPEIRWLTSYVTEDKLYCVYVAPNEDIILEHARCGGFPANRVTKVATMIDPSTGDAN